jgi:hypothetical protein
MNANYELSPASSMVTSKDAGSDRRSAELNVSPDIIKAKSSDITDET